MDIIINQQSISATVSRSLSIIGKRAVDDNGNLLFKDITLGSNETLLIGDYISNAVTALVTELGGFVSSYTPQTDTITVTLPSNHNSQLESFIKKSCSNYVVAYCLYSWFTITAPKIAEKYQGDMTMQLKSLIRMMNEKKAPSNTSPDVVKATKVTIS